MSEEKKDWKADAEEALQKTGDSLSAAWDATREGRMSALEATKEAARQLGEAIDKGVTAAKDRWGGEADGDTPSAETSEEE